MGRGGGKFRVEVNGPNQNHPLDIDLNLGSVTGFLKVAVGVVSTRTARLDNWLLGLDPEGAKHMAEGCWETICLDAFHLILAFPPLASAEMWSAGQDGHTVPAQ